MTKAEFIDSISQYPDNYELCLDSEGSLWDITDVDVDWNNNRILLYT